MRAGLWNWFVRPPIALPLAARIAGQLKGKMIERATRIHVFAAIIVLLVASAAAAHTPSPSFGSDLDLRFEATAPGRVQSFAFFTRTSAFAELKRIELTPPSAAEKLAEKLAVSAKLASGPRLFTLQSKPSESKSDREASTRGSNSRRYSIT